MKCKGCGVEFENDGRQPKMSKDLCYMCNREVRKRYDRTYREKNALSPTERLQVQACRSLFEVQYRQSHHTITEAIVAFLKALQWTDNDHFAKADKRLVQRWIDGEFDEPVKGRHDRIKMMQQLSKRQIERHRCVI